MPIFPLFFVHALILFSYSSAAVDMYISHFVIVLPLPYKLLSYGNLIHSNSQLFLFVLYLPFIYFIIVAQSFMKVLR